uniref:Uncharacterized protein n=1 Tax=Astyanax mexicanus TaxID=7994 RepID=A0A3B1KCA3_ASTMX
QTVFGDYPVNHDQFSCPVCLDLLKDPVTVPCGHSFCMVCINGCWDREDQRGIYSCPQCRETFTPRPVLRRNNMLAEVVEKLKKNTELQAASPAPHYAGAGDVECDFCTGRKLRAIKTCLMCLASFCEAHLKPHYEVPALKKHKLVTQLHGKICSQHDRLIEIYCRTDQSYICQLCAMEEHKDHNTISAKLERTIKQNHLKEIHEKLQHKIQEKQKKLQELKQTVNTLKVRTDQTFDWRIFTELIRSIEKKRSEVTELIRDQEKAELSGAEELLEKLQQEMADLKRRHTELEQLSHTEDHIHFLQVRKSLSELKERLEEFCREEFKKIPPHGESYFFRLTLDPNTAHRSLILSENDRMVERSKEDQPYSDHPERFKIHYQVLSKESVCGRCYWEAEWSGARYVYISVSYKEISRKGGGKKCWFGGNSESWSLQCYPSLSFYHNNIKTYLSAPPSSRIGVYVDHSAGLLSFYSVSDTMTLLYALNTTFTQPLYAGFRVGGTVRLCDKV